MREYSHTVDDRVSASALTVGRYLLPPPVSIRYISRFRIRTNIVARHDRYPIIFIVPKISIDICTGAIEFHRIPSDRNRLGLFPLGKLLRDFHFVAPFYM